MTNKHRNVDERRCRTAVQSVDGPMGNDRIDDTAVASNEVIPAPVKDIRRILEKLKAMIQDTKDHNDKSEWACGFRSGLTDAIELLEGRHASQK